MYYHYLKQNNSWEGPLLHLSLVVTFAFTHSPYSTGAWVWAVDLETVVFWLVTICMKDNFYVYILPYLLNPAKEITLKPHFKWGTLAYKIHL